MQRQYDRYFDDYLQPPPHISLRSSVAGQQSFQGQSTTSTLFNGADSSSLPGQEFVGSVERLLQEVTMKDGDQQLTTRALLDHAQLLIKVTRLKVTVGSSVWSYRNLCQRASLPFGTEMHSIQAFLDMIIPCIIMTPLDCFWEGAKVVDRQDTVAIPWFDHPILLHWTSLDPIGLLQRLKARRRVSDYHYHQSADEIDQLIELLSQAGLADQSYINRTCLDPFDPGCPASAPNYRNESPLDINRLLTNGCPGFASRLLHWPRDLIASSAHRNDSSSSSPSGLQSLIVLRSARDLYEDVRKKDPYSQVGLNDAQRVLDAWRRSLRQLIVEHNSGLEGTLTTTSLSPSSQTNPADWRYYTSTENTFHDLVRDLTLAIDPVKLVGCLLLVTLYSMLCLLDWRQPTASRCWLALAYSCLLLCLTAGAGLGLTALFRIPVNLLTIQVLPFLLTGLSFDALFQLTLCSTCSRLWAKASSTMPCNDRLSPVQGHLQSIRTTLPLHQSIYSSHSVSSSRSSSARRQLSPSSPSVTLRSDGGDNRQPIVELASLDTTASSQEPKVVASSDGNTLSPSAGCCGGCRKQPSLLQLNDWMSTSSSTSLTTLSSSSSLQMTLTRSTTLSRLPNILNHHGPLLVFNGLVMPGTFFLLAAFLPLPLTRQCCLQLGVCLLLHSLSSFLVLPILLELDAERRSQRRYDVLCCCTATVVYHHPDDEGYREDDLEGCQRPDLVTLTSRSRVGEDRRRRHITTNRRLRRQRPAIVQPPSTLVIRCLSRLILFLIGSHWLVQLVLLCGGLCLQPLAAFLFLTGSSQPWLSDTSPSNLLPYGSIDRSYWLTYARLFSPSSDFAVIAPGRIASTSSSSQGSQDFAFSQIGLRRLLDAIGGLEGVDQVKPHWLKGLGDWLAPYQRALDADLAVNAIRLDGSWTHNATRNGLFGLALIVQTDRGPDLERIKTGRLVRTNPGSSGDLLIDPPAFYTLLRAWRTYAPVDCAASSSTIYPDPPPLSSSIEPLPQPGTNGELMSHDFHHLQPPPNRLYHIDCVETRFRLVSTADSNNKSWPEQMLGVAKSIRRLTDQSTSQGVPVFPLGSAFTLAESFSTVNPASASLLFGTLIAFLLLLLACLLFTTSAWHRLYQLALPTAFLIFGPGNGLAAGLLSLSLLSLSFNPVTLVLLGFGIAWNARLSIGLLTPMAHLTTRRSGVVTLSNQLITRRWLFRQLANQLAPVVHSSVTLTLALVLLSVASIKTISDYFFRLIALINVICLLNAILVIPAVGCLLYRLQLFCQQRSPPPNDHRLPVATTRQHSFVDQCSRTADHRERNQRTSPLPKIEDNKKTKRQLPPPNIPAPPPPPSRSSSNDTNPPSSTTLLTLAALTKILQGQSSSADSQQLTAALVAAAMASSSNLPASQSTTSSSSSSSSSSTDHPLARPISLSTISEEQEDASCYSTNHQSISSLTDQPPPPDYYSSVFGRQPPPPR